MQLQFALVATPMAGSVQEWTSDFDEFVTNFSKKDPAVSKLGLHNTSVKPERCKDLCEAIANCTRTSADEGGIIIAFNYVEGLSDPKVLDELIPVLTDHAGKFRGWQFTGCFRQENTQALLVAERAASLDKIDFLVLHCNDLDVRTTLRILDVMAEKPKVAALKLGLGETLKKCSREEYQRALSAAAQLRIKFPSMDFDGLDRELKNRIVRASLHNEKAKLEVQTMQMSMIELYHLGKYNDFSAGEEGVMAEFDRIQKVTGRESERLFGLLPDLMDTYAEMGGLEWVQALPPDFDTYRGEGAKGQQVPSHIRKLPKDAQVKYLLAVSAYKDAALRKVCNELEKSLNELDSPSALEALLTKYELNFVGTATYESVEVKSSNQDLSGEWKQVGFYFSAPLYKNPNGKQIPFLARDNNQARWQFGDMDGSGTSLPDEIHGTDHVMRWRPEIKAGDKQQWDRDQVRWNCDKQFELTVTVLPKTHERSLQDGVAQFLERWPKPAKAPADQHNEDELHRFHGGENGHNGLVNVMIGPPKGFARALTKGPDWLLDLNRATFLFISPAVLALGFYVFRALVEREGGELTRLSNYMFEKDEDRGTRPSTTMKQPPCIHVNFKMEGGWTFEVMFMLSQFSQAKHQLHKYYDITRAKDPLEVLPPVFDVAGVKRKPGFLLEPGRAATELREEVIAARTAD